MTKFLLEYNGVKAEARYNDNQMLVAFEVHEQAGADMLKAFLLNMPLSCKPEWFKRLPGLKATPMADDLSFDKFWNAYAYKVGKKARAERLWDSLNPADRQRAIDYIGQYNSHLVLTNQNKLYPETYLAQARWNN